MSKSRVREGWTRLDPKERSRGRCGALWMHISGWHIQHCGHPTALYPYYLHHRALPAQIVMSHNGMGFTQLRETQQIVEEIAAGALAITRSNCVAGILRVPSRTASGSAIPPKDNVWDQMLGPWSKAGFAPLVRR